ncbi:uncharacterized protein LOC123869401 isoform X2 [Maniola jurtina]|uniref:uncharacterized protein LOC123869401 isoform X2 n=1 Tax=Maniola jurtina TaxID=191418 RepID=UPI001E68613A|nr:uncharacterized protein LOC123869401 isoform X2 [Maniola jurtina]
MSFTPHWLVWRNIGILQQYRTFHLPEVFGRNTWRTRYRLAIRQAIYSHRWNDLAYLLKKSPIWEQAYKRDLPIYFRALTILLMNHPTAKSQALLEDYVHMVTACRSVGTKQALYKAILSLPHRLFNKNHCQRNAKE